MTSEELIQLITLIVFIVPSAILTNGVAICLIKKLWRITQ